MFLIPRYNKLTTEENDNYFCRISELPWADKIFKSQHGSFFYLNRGNQILWFFKQSMNQFHFKYKGQPIIWINYISKIFFKNKFHILLLTQKKNNEKRIDGICYENYACYIFEVENKYWEPIYVNENVYLTLDLNSNFISQVFYLITNITQTKDEVVFDVLVNWEETRNIKQKILTTNKNFLSNNIIDCMLETNWLNFNNFYLDVWEHLENEVVKTSKNKDRRDKEKKYINWIINSYFFLGEHFLDYHDNISYNTKEIFKKVLENEELKSVFKEIENKLEKMWFKSGIYKVYPIIHDFEKDNLSISFYLEHYRENFAPIEQTRLKNVFSSIKWLDTKNLVIFTSWRFLRTINLWFNISIRYNSNNWVKFENISAFFKDWEIKSNPIKLYDIGKHDKENKTINDKYKLMTKDLFHDEYTLYNGIEWNNKKFKNAYFGLWLLTFFSGWLKVNYSNLILKNKTISYEWFTLEKLWQFFVEAMSNNKIIYFIKAKEEHK